jgi:hypothetical protein
MACFCEYGGELWGSIKKGFFLFIVPKYLQCLICNYCIAYIFNDSFKSEYCQRKDFYTYLIGNGEGYINHVPQAPCKLRGCIQKFAD